MLEIYFYKFLACPIGHLCLLSLSPRYKLYTPSKTIWPLEMLSLDLQEKLSDPHLKD